MKVLINIVKSRKLKSAKAMFWKNPDFAVNNNYDIVLCSRQHKSELQVSQEQLHFKKWIVHCI